MVAMSGYRYNGFFVDLFVRASNRVAINMYEKFGYTVYRRVLEYYSGKNANEVDEDAFGEISGWTAWPKMVRLTW
jgi:ribosomal protein S18 acetylase RimI-like enzyme